MSVDLPKPIASYFAADKADGDAVARCFTRDGFVKDEGHTYQGAAEIKQWKAGNINQVHLHEQAFRLPATGRNIRRHQPSYGNLSRQPGRPSVFLPS